MKRALFCIITITLTGSALAQTAKDKENNNDQSQQQTAPAVTVNPANLDFGDQVAKKPGKPQRLTVTNTGGKKLYINSAVISGDNKDDFSLSRDTCTGATIESNKSCVIDIVFTPAVTERRKAMLEITDNAADSPQKVTLIGNGINSVNVPPR